MGLGFLNRVDPRTRYLTIICSLSSLAPLMYYNTIYGVWRTAIIEFYSNVECVHVAKVTFNLEKVSSAKVESVMDNLSKATRSPHG